MLLGKCLGINKKSKEKFKLEYLPNELIFLIFEYLYYDDIIYSFNQLNFRFQFLLNSYDNYYLNISQSNLIEENFLFNIEQIKSLILSNDENSYLNIEKYLLINRIELFYLKLECLSIINTDDDNQLINLIFILPNFHRLRCLTISKKNFHYEKSIFNIILFKIKTLKYFKWNINNTFFNGLNKENIFEEKSSIEYYEFNYINYSDIIWIKNHTKNIKSIHICYRSFWCHYTYEKHQFENLISIKLNNITTKNNLQFFFQHFINLIKLKYLQIQGDFIREEYFIDGHQLKDFIQKSCPQLKVFKFFFILSKWSMKYSIDDFIQPFINDFWLKDKKWFIKCDYRAFFDRTYLYTIPFINKHLNYSNLSQIKSTTNQIFNIQQLTLYSIKNEDILLNNRLFNNIQSLIINKIDNNITYHQLNTFLNLSSIKHIQFISQINSKVFFYIFKYNSKNLISIQIDYQDLKQILRRQLFIRHYFKNIKQLIIQDKQRLKYKTYIPLTINQIKYIYYYFTNIQKLIIQGSIQSFQLIYLLNHFKNLKFLKVICYHLQQIDHHNIQQCLTNQSKKKFISKWSNHIFYIWIH